MNFSLASVSVCMGCHNRYGKCITRLTWMVLSQRERARECSLALSAHMIYARYERAFHFVCTKCTQKREQERSTTTTVVAADDDDIKGIIIMLLNMIHIIFFRSFIFFFFRSFVHSKYLIRDYIYF